MYCPKCGQHVSDNMRFCSRCGISLSEVSDWLAGGSALTTRQETALEISPRRKGTRRGAKTMFWGAILFPIFMAMSIAADSPGPLFFPFVVFMIGLAMFLYARLFGEASSLSRSKPDARLGTASASNSLPPPSDAGFIPAATRKVNTAEIKQPPSVTERTTKLLDHE